MADWTMAQAKRDFDRGLFKGFEVDQVSGGWAVRLLGKLGADGVGWLVDAREKQPRIFKTLDAAVSALAGVGFEVKRIGFLL